ncbi:Inner membrane localized protein, partial [Quillaja saponaria]
ILFGVKLPKRLAFIYPSQLRYHRNWKAKQAQLCLLNLSLLPSPNRRKASFQLSLIDSLLSFTLRLGTMTVASNSMVLPRSPGFQLSSASPIKQLDQCRGYIGPSNLPLSLKRAMKVKLSTSRRPLPIQASYRLCLFCHYSDGGRPSNASIFAGGFVLGGLIVGTLGCVYAPQISKALAGADKKDLMRKLPKFIYDEEKALEKTRKVLAEKIAQLNSAIDDVSSQLRSEDAPNGAAVSSDIETEAAI